MAFIGATVAEEAVEADLVLSAQQDLVEAPAAQQLLLAEAVLVVAPQPWVLLASAATCVGDTFTKVLVFGSKLRATKETSPLCGDVCFLT